MPRPLAVPGRILIVDDDERQRQALVAMLSDGDFETQVACDGQEALERLTTFNADVIVADLVMPRMDGFELLRHLKQRGDLTPAIALTGFGSIEKALSVVHDLKAFWFLEKPVEPLRFQDSSGTCDRLYEEPSENRRVEAGTHSSRRTREPGGKLPGDAADLLAHQAGGSHLSAGIDLRREWHGKGTGCARDSQLQPARAMVLSLPSTQPLYPRR